jgi:phage major head subunit gpT-like protein
MSANKGLSSRAIIGRFFETYNGFVEQSWFNDIAMTFESDQEGETYKWLGQTPKMSEWAGSRLIDGLRENGITITNKHWSNGIGIPISWVRRDKTGQIMMKIEDLAESAFDHRFELLMETINGAETLVCYDGQYFFDTDHSEGDSGTQSNDLTVDISAVPADVHGTTTAPSPEEVKAMIFRSVSAIKGFKDDRGRPMNRSARKFTVLVPQTYEEAAMEALYNPLIGGGNTNIIANNRKYQFELHVEPGLDWTEKLAVFRSDGRAKPFIFQQETDVQLKAKAEGSEEEFDNDRWTFGTDYWGNTGPGFWQHACMATAT